MTASNSVHLSTFELGANKKECCLFVVKLLCRMTRETSTMPAYTLCNIETRPRQDSRRGRRHCRGKTSKIILLISGTQRGGRHEYFVDFWVQCFTVTKN